VPTSAANRTYAFYATILVVIAVLVYLLDAGLIDKVLKIVR